MSHPTELGLQDLELLFIIRESTLEKQQKLQQLRVVDFAGAQKNYTSPVIDIVSCPRSKER